ncbi:MAG: sigma-70 family RNA polymerase sigma factor [Anaerolineae bacterium]|nr:sigma-70 family RNA polymerase sigma factor [Anaerolineae bacterium]
MDEEAVIRAAQGGQLSAFNQLVMWYQGLAYNVAYRILGDPDAAADATQDSFLKAYRSLKSFRGGAFKSWLLRIVTNTCYDRLRAQKRRPTSSLDDLTIDPEHATQLTYEGEGPEEHMLRWELSDLIQEGIRRLPEDQRTTLVLADIEGLSYQEIAEITGVQLGTVKSRLSRGRARLRDYLLERQELLPKRYRLKNTKD